MKIQSVAGTACLAVLTLGVTAAFGDIERKLTPVMGWSSWNSFGANVDYGKVKAQMDALVKLGLRDLGWTYVNIDDCFQDGRDEKGRLRVNEKKFPGGHRAMRDLVDYAHAHGLKAGIYSDGGDNVCSSGGGKGTVPAGRDVGFWRHEVDDANLYLADGNYRDAYARAHPEDPGLDCWGFDFIKIDWCGGGHAKLTDSKQYNKIMDAIDDVERRMGKQKIVNICRWRYAGPWQFRADSWRSGPDIAQTGDSWESVMVQVDIMKELWQYTRPGSMNDPDMLVAGLKLTPEEDKSHFAMWCLFSSPLLIGQDLTKIKPATLALYRNAELIALNQDPAVLSAGYLGDLTPGVEIWVKMLGNDRSMVRALALLNRNPAARTVTFKYETAGYSGKVRARDLFAHTTLPADTARTVTLPPHGIDVLKLEPADGSPVVGPRFAACAGNFARGAAAETKGRLDWVNAFEAVRNGARLVDVRSPEEFAAGHVEGAINVPHTRVGTEIARVIPDTNTPIVCYCKLYKRAAQAALMLETLHYRDVHFVGDGYEASKSAPRVSLADVTKTVVEIKDDGKERPFWANPWRLPWPVAKGKPNRAWSGKPLTLGGRTFEKGVGTEAVQRGGGTIVQCAVPEGATHFVARVGIDDSSPDKTTPVAFAVHVDAALAAETHPLAFGETHLFAVPVSGAKTVKLFATAERPVHVDWIGAGFVVRAGAKVADVVRARADRRIAAIRATPNGTLPAGVTAYYVSAHTGDDAADGRTPATAWRTVGRLNRAKTAPGSFVLFARGGLYRGMVEARQGVTYTAYGAGPKPIVCGSPENGADPAKWTRTDAPNVWSCEIGHLDVGTLVFDDGAQHARKVICRTDKKTGARFSLATGRPFNSYRDLDGDLHFWHDYYEKGTGRLYLYSAENPGKRFRSIEFNIKCSGFNVGSRSDVTIDNFTVKYVGIHGVAANTCRNLTVSNCEFGWIGGSIQAEGLFGRDHPTRYGNGVEIYGGCDGYLVTNCYVWQVYDAGVTHQFNIPAKKGKKRFDQRNVRYVGNVMEKCNYSIEYFLTVPQGNESLMENILMEDNLMFDSGFGFCEQRPDLKQAAHIKAWYHGSRNRAKNFVIRNNVFCGAGNMIVQICAGLRNVDGTSSLPTLTDNVFIGAPGCDFGMISEKNCAHRVYGPETEAFVNTFGSGNRCEFP